MALCNLLGSFPSGWFALSNLDVVILFTSLHLFCYTLLLWKGTLNDVSRQTLGESQCASEGIPVSDLRAEPSQPVPDSSAAHSSKGCAVWVSTQMYTVEHVCTSHPHTLNVE